MEFLKISMQQPYIQYPKLIWPLKTNVKLSLPPFWHHKLGFRGGAWVQTQAIVRPKNIPRLQPRENTITVLLMVQKSQTTTCDIEPCKIMGLMGWTTNLNWWVYRISVAINSITESPRNHLCTFQAMPRFRGKEKTIQILRLPAIVRPPGDLRFGWGGWDFLGMLRNFNARWDV